MGSYPIKLQYSQSNIHLSHMANICVLLLLVWTCVYHPQSCFAGDTSGYKIAGSLHGAKLRGVRIVRAGDPLTKTVHRLEPGIYIYVEGRSSIDNPIPMAAEVNEVYVDPQHPLSSEHRDSLRFALTSKPYNPQELRAAIRLSNLADDIGKLTRLRGKFFYAAVSPQSQEVDFGFASLEKGATGKVLDGLIVSYYSNGQSAMIGVSTAWPVIAFSSIRIVDSLGERLAQSGRNVFDKLARLSIFPITGFDQFEHQIHCRCEIPRDARIVATIPTEFRLYEAIFELTNIEIPRENALQSSAPADSRQTIANLMSHPFSGRQVAE